MNLIMDFMESISNLNELTAFPNLLFMPVLLIVKNEALPGWLEIGRQWLAAKRFVRNQLGLAAFAEFKKLMALEDTVMDI